jgi:hypothetical protein
MVPDLYPLADEASQEYDLSIAPMDSTNSKILTNICECLPKWSTQSPLLHENVAFSSGTKHASLFCRLVSGKVTQGFITWPPESL